WSAQLGQSPTRIVCVGLTSADQSSPDGAALAGALVQAWPGATVDAAADADPVGATLARLAAGPDAPDDALDSPRRSLVALTQRPGKLHRRLYQWVAAATFAAAAAIAILGWRMQGAAAAAREAADTLHNERLKALAPLEKIAPGVSTSASP